MGPQPAAPLCLQLQLTPGEQQGILHHAALLPLPLLLLLLLLPCAWETHRQLLLLLLLFAITPSCCCGQLAKPAVVLCAAGARSSCRCVVYQLGLPLQSQPEGLPVRICCPEPARPTPASTAAAELPGLPVQLCDVCQPVNLGTWARSVGLVEVRGGECGVAASATVP